MAGFKILLIILIAAPVVVISVIFYAQMLGYISRRNRAESGKEKRRR